MGLTPTPQNEILTFAISFCKTFWGAPTSSVRIAKNLSKRLFYYTAILSKWQQFTKIILATYLLSLTNVNINPDKEVISMSLKQQSVTTYLLTRTNVNRNQEEALFTTTTTETHARTTRRQKLRMIDRTWCRRVGNEYDSTMRTKQRSIGPQQWQRQLHDKNKMAIDEGIDVFTMKTKGGLVDKNKRTIDWSHTNFQSNE